MTRATPMWAGKSSARCSEISRNGREWNKAMSRVGKKPVPIPSGVTADVEGQTFKVKGPKGALQLVLHGDVAAKVEAGEVNGVGYRAAVQGKNLQLQLGYAHDIVYPIPEGITIATPKATEIVITGID